MGVMLCPAYHHLGKSDPYCEVTMGAQVFTSRTLNDTLNPKWNFNCQFHIKDIYQDVLCITIFERDQFSPDGQYSAPLLCSNTLMNFLGSVFYEYILLQNSKDTVQKLHIMLSVFLLSQFVLPCFLRVSWPD